MPFFMKIAYGTYAMPTVPLEKALVTVAEIGYDGLELAIGPKHNSMPEQIDASKRQKLKKMFAELNLGVPALFMLGSLLTEDKETHKKNLQLTTQVMELARDLDIGARPVISMGIGGRSASWEAQRDPLLRLLDDYAKVAADEGFIFAIEPHSGAMVDRTERAIWIMETLDNPYVRLHFDIVHFFMGGEEIEETVFKLVPYTAHTHVTDAKKTDEGYELVLMGQGDLDALTYVKAMHQAGWTDFITLEVSVRVWGREDYDVNQAAKQSYAVLDEAFKKAMIPRD
ncbi:sugar phosphate isomerase/epimerase [bacterium]|nr:sugar phosphate isomerase/epimerase [bacterium]